MRILAATSAAALCRDASWAAQSVAAWTLSRPSYRIGRGRIAPDDSRMGDS